MEPSEHIASATRAINGTRAKSLREEQGLTQLYVATMVGVTTDTISRWEQKDEINIKQENAAKLATALNIELDEIDSSLGLTETDKNPKRTLHLTLGVITIGAAVIGLLFLLTSKPPHPTISFKQLKRELPLHAAPGSIIPVRVHLELSDTNQSMILTEQFPRTWQLIESSPPPSSLDNIAGISRWMLKGGNVPSTIDYLIKIPEQATESSTWIFSGAITTGEYKQREPVSIPESKPVTIGYFHWADQNRDLRIDDAEVLDAFDLYDEMKGVHLDWDSIEQIWDKGSYQWEMKN